MTARRASILVTAAFTALAATSASAQVGDHLTCFTTKDPLKLSAAADLAATLQPEFSNSGCVIGKPKQFCTPTS